MNKKILYQFLSLGLLINLSTYAINDPRLTRDVVIDIDATLTACCAQIDINFQGTFTVIAELSDLFELVSGVCSPNLIGQAEVGTTGYVITTSGVYKLSEDIIFNPAGSAAAITINADNVLLDLQCFSITQGNATASVDGISIAANRTNVIIHDGQINNFSRDGIRVASGASNIAYADITIQDCLYGIFCLGTSGAPIEILNGIGLDFIGNSTGVSLTFVNRAQLSESSWFNQAYAGVELINSFSNSITNCLIEKTGSATGSAVGVSLVEGGNNRVEKCSIDGVSTNDTFSGNSAVGILLDATENDDLILNNQISNCTTTSNAQPFGIEMRYTLTGLTLATSSTTIGSSNKIQFSPNSRYVGISGTDGTQNVPRIFELDDAQLKVISNNNQSASNVSGFNWSPDGQFVAAAYVTGNRLNVFKFQDAELQLYSFITVTGVFGNARISWSPDGRYIALGNSTANTTQIFKFSDLGSSGTLQLVSQISVGNRVVWSPDGMYIAITNDASSQISVYSFLQNNLTLVTTLAVAVSSIDWSPDGQFISYTTSAASGLVILRFTGSSLIPVANLNVAAVTLAFWSPDGKYLFVVIGAATINLVNFTGNGLFIVETAATTGFLLNFPDWIPNGTVVGVTAGTPLSLTLYNTFYFPSGHFIKGNTVSRINGPALPAGQPGVSSGRGISGSSANNLIYQNKVFDADLAYVFVDNIFQQFAANASQRPTLLSNIFFPPL